MKTQSKQTCLTPADYRKFGLLMAAFLLLLFVLIFPWLFNAARPLWPWPVALVFATLALLAPGLLKPACLGWMKLGGMLNWINTRIILGLVFYTIFLPTGIMLRLLGKDPLRTRLDKNADSYRIENTTTEKQNMEQPY
ncbi:MAG TPA: sxtJ [Thiotrichales bacterium]|nr:sxtJ [Thiotrichales bacterium]